jgi:2'-5' RNA ligase
MVNPKYGSLMFYPNVDKIKWRERISKVVDPEAEIDLNFRPHITIFYGFDNSLMDVERLRIIVNNFILNNPFSLHADKVSTFDNNPPIVKIDIIDLNGNITRLNNILSNEFECIVEYLIYSPHITIGVIDNKGPNNVEDYIELEDFGFKSLNSGIIKYYDGIKNSSIITSF